jgi:hypothetical protein
MVNFINLFQLPERSLVTNKVTKAFFKRNFDLTLSERKLLDDFSIIQQMDWLASIKPDNLNIPAFENEKESYEEVVLISVQTTLEQFDRQKFKIADLVQKYIPYPVVLLVYDNVQFIINVAEKRINGNDKTKRTIEKMYHSENISFDTQLPKHLDFIKSLAFENADKLNLKQFYENYIQSVTGLQTAQISGTFASRPIERTREDVLILEQINALQQQINSLQNRAIKETQMSERVFLNTQIQEIKKVLNDLKQKISANPL